MNYKIILSIFFLFILHLQSCKKKEEKPEEGIKNKLSEYGIYSGTVSDLVPSSDFKLYELASTAFSDFSEKQRLLKLPAGTQLQFSGNGLPLFPEGSLLVKTFFYHHDKRYPAKGKQLIETRVLIKSGDTWLAATYKWNEEQTDGFLIESGSYKSVNWIDAAGKGKVVSYRIPSNAECKSCHQSGNTIIPIGPKLRNMNREVIRDGESVNQLRYFMKNGIIGSFNTGELEAFPDWHDETAPLEKRGRAYLEINCAHCHSDNGSCSIRSVRFPYEVSAGSATIKEERDMIETRMQSGNMPKLGTTVIDDEGLTLIKAYLKTL